MEIKKMIPKKHSCDNCIHCMTYRETQPAYEEDKVICTLSPKIACWEITKCSHYKEKK